MASSSRADLDQPCLLASFYGGQLGILTLQRYQKGLSACNKGLPSDNVDLATTSVEVATSTILFLTIQKLD